MPHDPYKALYIHIPFCVSRCFYCDFVTSALAQDSPDIDNYIEDICGQIRRKSNEGELSNIETVYIGGGTPSYVGMNRLSMLLYTLITSMRLEPDIECTMEANPESLTENMVQDIWALGVNRLSLGVQSFNDRLLTILGRAHNANDARCALERAQRRFENISVDLMCGIPGQDVEDFLESLKEAIDFGVKHVSIYPLTIEDHTVFSDMVLREQIDEPDEDMQADMMRLAAKVLGAAGYERYEVASYAKPGFECRHNITYWTGKPYIGFGYSAVTMTQNSERRMRVQDDHVSDDLDPAQMMAEDLMLGMRMTCGVSDETVERAAFLLPTVKEVFSDLVEDGLVKHENGRWKPTDRGWLFDNELSGALFNLAP